MGKNSDIWEIVMASCKPRNLSFH